MEICQGNKESHGWQDAEDALLRLQISYRRGACEILCLVMKELALDIINANSPYMVEMDVSTGLFKFVSDREFFLQLWWYTMNWGVPTDLYSVTKQNPPTC